MNYETKDTICALATPAGHSAVALVRVSGNNSKLIFNLLCPKFKKSIESHRSYLTNVYDQKLQIIDQVLITFFKGKASYTGEDSFEISCHGNPVIIKKIISQLNFLGVRLANPGEFTFRSFMNGKIDLVQAEAIHALIVSQTDASAKISLRQLDGHTSVLFKNIESDLIWCLAHIEASIDFSTEGLDIIDDSILIKKIEEIQNKLSFQLNQYAQGQIIKNGLKLSLVGQPNVGKSSLLNLLVQSDKAIVADIAGTTRDVIEAQTIFNGQIFNFSDTAGLRETTDQIEKIGVNKSLQELKKSDLNIFIIDCNLPSTELFSSYIVSNYSSAKEFTDFSKFIIVFNKSDLVNEHQRNSIEKTFKDFLKTNYDFQDEQLNNIFLFVSALNSNDRSTILNFCLSQFERLDFMDESVVSSARQIEMVAHSVDFIRAVKSELQAGLGSEFIAQSLKEALLSIQRILGHVYDDQILDRVFKEFCLGK